MRRLFKILTGPKWRIGHQHVGDVYFHCLTFEFPPPDMPGNDVENLVRFAGEAASTCLHYMGQQQLFNRRGQSLTPRAREVLLLQTIFWQDLPPIAVYRRIRESLLSTISLHIPVILEGKESGGGIYSEVRRDREQLEVSVSKAMLADLGFDDEEGVSAQSQCIFVVASSNVGSIRRGTEIDVGNFNFSEPIGVSELEALMIQ